MVQRISETASLISAYDITFLIGHTQLLLQLLDEIEYKRMARSYLKLR